MQEVIIRHAKAADFEAIKNIYAAESVYAETLQLPFPTDELWQSNLANRPAGSYRLVAEMAGEIVGEIGLSASQNPRRKHVVSFGMGVKAAFHRQGIGRQLLAAVIDLSDNWLNATRMEISVYTDNTAAIALYQKFGFKIEGEAIDYAFRNGRYANVLHMARLK